MSQKGEGNQPLCPQQQVYQLLKAIKILRENKGEGG